MSFDFPDPAPIPERIGSYRILRKLGEGGMGSVYEAEQEKPRRHVALKVLKPEFATPQFLKRFEREANVLGLLQHPGIAQVYEAGTADTGSGPQPYFAMELVQGETLTNYASKHRLTTRQKLELVARVCDAVQHAHQKGIVHRDIKPGNVLVVAEAPSDSTTTSTSRMDARARDRDIAHVGQPKVLDFGIARVTDADVKSVTIQTEVGQILGTVRYMSPEQVEGDSNRVDTRSDIYALGAVTYELLCGRTPHDSYGLSLFDAMRAIREDEPTRLSTVDRAFHGDVDTIVAKALEKEKARRYASAGEMAADIRRFLHDEPIVARRPSTIYQLKKFAARNRVLVGGVAATFVALVAGIVATSLQSISAVRARDDAQRAAQEAKAMNDFLVQDLLLSADPYEMKGRTVTIEDVLEQASQRVDEAFRDQPLVAASVRATMGRIFLNLGRNDDAEAHLRFAWDTFRRLRGDESPETVDVMQDLGRVQHRRHVLDEAETLLRRVIELRRRIQRPEARPFYAGLVPLAQVLRDKGDTAGAESTYEEVVESLGQHPDLNSQERSALAAASCDLANIVLARGGFDRALALYDDALRILRESQGEVYPDFARVLGQRAKLLSELGRHKEAYESYLRCLEIQQSVFRSDHPDIATTQESLGLVASQLADYAEAESHMRKAIELRIALHGEDAPETAGARVALSRVLIRQDRSAEAESVLRTAIASLSRSPGPDSVDLADAEFALVLAMRIRKDYAGALPICEDVVRIRRMHGEDAPRELVTAESLLTQLHHSLGDLALAEQGYRDVLATYVRLEGEATVNVAVAHANLGGVLESQGKLAEAEVELARGLEIARERLAENPMLADFLNKVAGIELALGKLEKASATLEEALEIARRMLPRVHSTTATALSVLGEVRLEQGRAADAEPLLREAVEGRRSFLAEGDFQRAMAESLLGRCLVAQKRYDEAEPLLEGAYTPLEKWKLQPRYARHAASALAELHAAKGAVEKAAAWAARASTGER